MKHYSLGRTVAGCAIGAGMALCMPFLLPLSVVIVVPALLLLALFAAFGPVSAAVSAVLCVASAGSLFGAVGIYAGLFVMVLPAAVGCVLLWRKAGYALRMKGALIAQAVGLAAFLGITTLTVGMSLADAFTQFVYGQISAMPAGFADYYLAMMGAIQLPETGIDLLHGVLSAQERAELMEQALATQNNVLKLGLPGMLASSCLYTGILCGHVPSRMLARRGAGLEHWGVHKWHLGRDATIFAILCFVTSLYFLVFSRSSAAAPAYIVFDTIANIAFTMQGMGAVDRMCLKSGQSRTKRAWILVGLFALSQLTQFGISVLALVGIASAVWGSQGLLAQHRQRRRERRNDDNNHDEGEF